MIRRKGLMIILDQIGYSVLVGFLIAVCVPEAAGFAETIRVRRVKHQSEFETNSILTVEWEGIHAGVSDSSIRGFRVEYRPEEDDIWTQHDGIIPYKGADYQYRVRIKNLPGGRIYYVRISIVDREGNVIIQTPPIKAHSEDGSVKVVCSPGQITSPTNIQLKLLGYNTVRVSWEAPECGAIKDYVVRVEVLDRWGEFDVREATFDGYSGTIRNLLPGTKYSFQVKGKTADGREGEWSEMYQERTEGQAPRVSTDIRTVYRTDKSIRIEWDPYRGPGTLNHYEVTILEYNDGQPVRLLSNVRVPPNKNFYIFEGLKSDTQYMVGVLAFDASGAKVIYQLREKTAAQGADDWEVTPSINRIGIGKFSVHWTSPSKYRNIKGFLVEYHLPNETDWHQYGKVIPYRPGSKDYGTELTGLDGRIIYVVRVHVLDQKGRVIAQTGGFNVGSQTQEVCTGKAGVPSNIKTEGVGQTTITYTWDKPDCREDFGPIEGYEYKVWNIDSGSIPARPKYTSETRCTETNLVPGVRYGFQLRTRSRGGLSPWSTTITKATNVQPVGPEDPLKPYNLRVILAPSKPYLAWRAPRPGRGQGRIVRYRVRYIIAKETALGNWKIKTESPSYYRCPPRVGEPNDFCYDLSGLKFGIQYNAKVAAQFQNGEWSPDENLHFLLVAAQKPPQILEPTVSQRGATVIANWEVIGNLQHMCCYQLEIQEIPTGVWKTYGSRIPHSGQRRTYSTQVTGLRGNTEYYLRVKGLRNNGDLLCTSPNVRFVTQCSAPSEPPKQIEVQAKDARNLHMTWRHPNRHTWGCSDIYYNVELTVNGQRKVVRVQPRDLGGFRVEHSVPAVPGTKYTVRMQTANSGGVSPWSRSFIVQTPSEALATTPVLTPYGDQLKVNWKSVGRGSGVVAGYMVEYRGDRRQPWSRSGSLVPFRGDNAPYTTTIPGLRIGQTYWFRVLVMDRNQRVIYTTPEASTKTTCKIPTQPPISVAPTAPDSRHVRVTFREPPMETWLCDDVYYELSVLEPRGIETVRLRRGQTQHVFSANPNQKWTVRMRTINSAGSSPWSRSVSVTTPPPRNLIEGLRAYYERDTPTLTWRSLQGVGDLVSGYRVQYYTDRERRWKPHSSGLIRFVGAQRPYKVPMPDLRPGQTVQLRVEVYSQNQELLYTSPPVSLVIRTLCKPPLRPPTELKADSLGTNQIRLMWKPLARSEWNCDSVRYIVKYTTPRTEGFRNFSSYQDTATFSSQPFTQWTLKIKAANPAGESRWSQEVTTRTKASVPGRVKNLVGTPLGPDSARVTWSPPDRPNGVITGYEVTYQLLSRGLCQENPEPERRVTTINPSTVLQSLVPNSRYRISVAAKTTIVGEPISTEVTTGHGVPTAPPSNVQARDITDRSARLVWQAPPCLQTNGEISKYEYNFQGVDRWAINDVRTETAQETQSSVDGLTPYTNYRVKVRAFTNRGPGPWSRPVVITTLPSGQGNKVVELKVYDTDKTTVSLFWQSPVPPYGEIDNYKIRYVASGPNRWKERIFNIDQLRCPREVINAERFGLKEGAKLHCTTIDGLAPGRQYDFQVAPHVATGDYGPWSPKLTASTVRDEPVQVLDLRKIRGSESSLLIGWDIRPDLHHRVRGFRILVHPDGRQGQLQQYTVGRSPPFEYQIESLTPNTPYNVTVQANTDSGYHIGNSKTMNTDDAHVPPVSIAPRVIDRTSESVTVQWDAPRNARNVLGYRVEYRVRRGDPFVMYGQEVPHQQGRSSYSSQVGGLAPNSDVYIQVVTTGRKGRKGDPSPEVTARTDCGAPSISPQTVRFTAPAATQVSINWEAPNKSSWNCDSISYEISYRQDGGSDQIVPVEGTRTEYTIPSDPYQSWFAKIRTVNRAGSSPWSRELDAVTPEGPPGPVVGLVLTPRSPNEVHVKWQKPTTSQGRIVGYDVSYRLKRRLACPEELPSEWVTVYKVKNLEYLLQGLLPYSEYEIKVAARTTELGPEESKLVTTQQAAPTAPPRNLKSSFAVERSLSFNWNPPECEQQHGVITFYQYDLMGLDDWAKTDIRFGNVTDTQVNIENLTPYTKYRMRVKAFTSVGAGPSTSDLDVMTAKAGAPPRPQDVTVIAEGTDFIKIMWSPPYPPYGPIDSYKVRYRKLSTSGVPEGGWQEKSINANDPMLLCEGIHVGGPRKRLCHKITPLESGQHYQIQLAAHVQGGSIGEWSSPVDGYTVLDKPVGVKSISLIGHGHNYLHVRWIPQDDPKGLITHYKLTADGKPQDYRTHKFIISHPSTDYKVPDLHPDNDYVFTVYSGTKQDYGPGTSKTFRTDQAPIPRVGTKPKITSSGPDYLVVEWNAVSDPDRRASGYILEYRRYDESQWNEFGKVVRHDPSQGMYTERITDLNPDTAYLVRVKVVDVQNQVGDPSPQAEGRTGCQSPSSPPRELSVDTPTADQVRTRWRTPPPPTWRCSRIEFKLRHKNGTHPDWTEVQLPSSRTDHGLVSEPYTKWTIQMRTENSAGHSDWTDAVTLITPEAAPGKIDDLKCKPQGPDTTDCDWKPPKKPNGVITGYLVTYRLKSKGPCPYPPGQPITKRVNSPRYLLKDLEPASTYEISVVARTTENGPPSTPILVTTEEAAPTGAPRTVEVDNNRDKSLAFKWDEPTCEEQNGRITGYEYQLKGLDQWATGTEVKDRSSGPRTDVSGLTPYTRYAFKVRAINSKGHGPYSEFIDGITLAGAPPAPRDVRADQAFPTSIEISFLPPFPPHGIIDEYRIRHTTTDRVNYVDIRQRPEQLKCAGTVEMDRYCYRLLDLEAEKQYLIQVSAHTRDGDWGDWSDPVYENTKEDEIPVLPSAPRVSDKNQDCVTLTWPGVRGKDAKKIVGYVIEYSQSGTSEWKEYPDIVPSKGIGGQVHIKKVCNLLPDTEYYFHVRLRHKNGKTGLPSPKADARTNCGKPSSPPQQVSASSPNVRSVHVKWEAPHSRTWNCGKVSYVMKFDNGTNSGYLDFDPTLGETSHEFVAQPGSTWKIQMRTQAMEDDEKGLTSEWSPEVKVKVKAPPDEIYVKVSKKGPDQAIVDWEYSGEDYPYGVDAQYQLKRRGSCDPTYYEPTTLYSIKDKRFILKNLEPYSEYEITVTSRTPPNMLPPGKQPAKESKTITTGEKEPSGPPESVQVSEPGDTSLGFRWEPPACEKQNGEISQYEYKFSGVDEFVKNDQRQTATARKQIRIEDLFRGTRYQIEVRAWTSAGPGPWSEPVQAKTTGSVAPRELQPVDSTAHSLTIAWLPPYSRRDIDRYEVQYQVQNAYTPKSVTATLRELSCDGIRKLVVSPSHNCYTIKGLRQKTTYVIQVRAKAKEWGEWTPQLRMDTKREIKPGGGELNLVESRSDALEVDWKPPGLLEDDIQHCMVGAVEATKYGAVPQNFKVSSTMRSYTFANLKSGTPYNVTVKCLTPAEDGGDRVVWFVSEVFQTKPEGHERISWLSAPTNLGLRKKTDTLLHSEWDPPDVLLPAYAKLFTNYRVTITPLDDDMNPLGPTETTIVPRPGQDRLFTGLPPATMHNLTVEAGTKEGYGAMTWGVFSTLPRKAPWVVRLIRRTPTSLHVEWNPPWESVATYTLTANPVQGYTGGSPPIPIDGSETDYIIKNLIPSSTYNVTLKPMGIDREAWGVYSTLPPKHHVVTNLAVCDRTTKAISFSWDPILDTQAVHYQVRYAKQDSLKWEELPQKSTYDYRCPGNPCGVHKKLCYAIYNLATDPEFYYVQVRAYVDGDWNRWKTVTHRAVSQGPSPEPQDCCIVAPPDFVEHVGAHGSIMEVKIRPMHNHSRADNVRCYVLVDHQEQRGNYNETRLYDKVTAGRKSERYYVTGAFDRTTLGAEKIFKMGDGKIYGGYINYPLEPGTKPHWAEFCVLWHANKPPEVAHIRYGNGEGGGNGNRFIDSRGAGYKIGAWPWWWLLLLLALLLLLLLLCCCLFWCCSSRYRRRRRVIGHQYLDVKAPLIEKEKGEMQQNLKQLESRIDTIREQLETKTRTDHHYYHGSRDGDRDSDSSSDDGRRSRKRLRSKGDFEDGYVRGFRDAGKIGGATTVKRRLDEEYGDMRADFHTGYVQGLRDAGLTGMSQSMHDLAARRTNTGGYSAGYMQGFRDGNSGVYGDRITTSLLRRLEVNYPNQDDYRQGYIEGFRDATTVRTESRVQTAPAVEGGVKDRLLEITDRLSTLERTKVAPPVDAGPGDELHTTRIYHVYNQLPDTGPPAVTQGSGYTSAGQQLAQELEMESSSRRSTLRRHYTPGDYLKYPSDTEGYTSVRRHRRALSASNVGRDEYYPPVSPMSSTPRGAARYDQTGSRASVNDTFSRRYNYRSRSDIGSYGTLQGGPRRYGSQTILSGPRPGPSTPTARREALETLQRELDTISRTGTGRRAGGAASSYRYTGSDVARGYSSDTGYVNDTWRSRYGQTSAGTTAQQSQRATGGIAGGTSSRSAFSPEPQTHFVFPSPGTNRSRVAGGTTVGARNNGYAGGSEISRSWGRDFVAAGREYRREARAPITSGSSGDYLMVPKAQNRDDRLQSTDSTPSGYSSAFQ